MDQIPLHQESLKHPVAAFPDHTGQTRFWGMRPHAWIQCTPAFISFKE